MKKIILDLNKLRKRLKDNQLLNVDCKEYFGNDYNHKKQKIKVHDKITLFTKRLHEEVEYEIEAYFNTNGEIYRSISVFWTSLNFKEIGIVLSELIQILDQTLSTKEVEDLMIEMIKNNAHHGKVFMGKELIEFLDKLIVYVINALKR